jgi:hypothetical protein
MESDDSLLLLTHPCFLRVFVFRFANKDYLTLEDLQLFLEGEQGVSELSLFVFVCVHFICNSMRLWGRCLCSLCGV